MNDIKLVVYLCKNSDLYAFSISFPYFQDFSQCQPQSITNETVELKRRKDGEKAVSIYEIDETRAFAECSVLHFDSANEAWLDFVSENRSGNYTGEPYDFIFGAVMGVLVEQVVHLITENYAYDELTASIEFYNSKVYALLEQEETKLWHFSPLTLLLTCISKHEIPLWLKVDY